MAPTIRRLAIVLTLLGATAFAADRTRDITDTLAIQEAMRSGREMIIRGENAKAVELLEKQLGRINGDPTYLALLREAYAGFLKDLQLAGKTETLEVYRARLAVLDKVNAKPNTPSVAAAPEKPRGPIARGARPDDDPFQQVPLADQYESIELLDQADKAFAAKQYELVVELYARANLAAPPLTPTQKMQWAYSIIACAVAKMNSPNPPPASGTQNEILAALTMVPDDSELARFGKTVLEKLKGSNPPGNSGIPVEIGPIKHSAAADGWAKTESANFRLFHNQPKEAAEQTIRLAEQHRATIFAKWATTNPSSWQPICELYLYSKGAEYAKATSQPATAPGHSTIKVQGGKVQSRRMDLRLDDPNFMGSVLPHEITHVVLADLFADQPLPRWADEGMAVLSEPRSQVDRFGKTLISCRRKGQLLPLAQLLSKPDYPDAATVTVFYVESVSVVEFLVNQKGPAAFVTFMRDANRGFDSALSKHYGMRNVGELQDNWLRATFTEVDRIAAVPR